MRWAAMNGVGAALWVVALQIGGSVQHPGAIGAWVPADPLYVAIASGVVGLATLLWANLADA